MLTTISLPQVTTPLYLKPFAWTEDGPWCRNREGRVIKLTIDMSLTMIVKYADVVDDNQIFDMIDNFQPDDIQRGIHDYRTVYMRDPVLETTDTTNFSWTAADTNPEGPVFCLWRARGIHPYDWILVTKWLSNSDNDIQAREEHIFPGPQQSVTLDNILFWDIEALSETGEFTDANKKEDRIFSISVITVAGNDSPVGYLLVDGSINEKLIPKTEIPMTVLSYNGEADLICGFLQIWSQSRPNRIVYHNGDSYDMPYLIRRINLHNILPPQLGPQQQAPMTPLSTHIIYTQSVVGVEPQIALDVPGIEMVDLLYFFRRFNPGLPNYRLETIANLFLGEGKSGLSIDDMFAIVKSGDPDRMAKVGWYSFKDTVLLYKLWQLLHIGDIITEFSNISLCTAEELLRMTNMELIRRIITKIDPCVSLSSFSISVPTHYVNLPHGFHRDVKLYGYENLVTRAFEYLIDYYKSNPEEYGYTVYLENILDNIRHLPCNLQNIAIYSSIVKDSVPAALISLLSQLQNVISIDENFVYIRRGADLTELLGPPRAIYSLILSLSSASSIMVIMPDTILRYGSHKLCRPSYAYVKQLVDWYMMEIVSGRDPRKRSITMEDVKAIDPHLLTITVKVKSIDHYKPGSDTVQARIAKLLNDRGINIQTWASVTYIHTIDGIYIVNRDADYLTAPAIDTKKYAAEINSIYKQLDSLTTRSI